MNSPRFLLDEHVAHAIARGLVRRVPDVEIAVIGQPGMPALGTLDPDLLVWIETHDYLLVTNNRRTMPGHLATHLAAGRHVPGILVASDRLALRAIIEQLALIWEAALPGEFRDQIIYLPLPG